LTDENKSFFHSKKGNWCKACYNEYRRDKRAKLKIKQGEVEQGEPLEIPPIMEGEPQKEQPKKESKKAETKVNLKEVKNTATAVLQTVFGVVASRAGEHWNISKDEADNITTPLVNILNKYDMFKKVTKNMDSINLVMAIGAFAIPRAMVQMEIIKQQKEEKKKKGEQLHGTNKPEQEEIKNKAVIREINKTDKPKVTDIPKAYDRETFQPAIL
jgi:hypothetical protein